ncbi:MAG: tetratricopeptide repeat protein [Gemmatimonadales bacterium]|nr:tetratricopeptide repeat protein [Gemmatimonadales bacterium]
MPSSVRFIVCAILAGAAPAVPAAHLPLAAQAWTPPQPPCDIKPGHFRLNSAVVNLKTAAERPNTRERMLRQTQDVLIRSITNDGQSENPAAWYYFGRYYVEMKDAAGADSAFRKAVALAPQCREDIDRYRSQLWTDVLAAGMRTWQENKIDSAKALLRQAGALRPNHPRSFWALGQIYVAQNQLDSATIALNQAAAAAGEDTAFADTKKEALGTVARVYARRVQNDPAAQRWQHTRFSRDSIQRLLTIDSIILARVEASSASRRARGARLAPADQQAFSRDSSTRVRGGTERRAALAARAQAVAADSAAAAPAYEPAIAAARTYLQTYPAETEVISILAGLYYQSGRIGEAQTTFDAVYPAGGTVAPETVLEAGRGALRANLLGTATTLLARGLERRPFDRDALTDLANGYLALRDSVRLLPVAQRLAAVDPLNRTTLRLLAAGWELRGGGGGPGRDSAQKYRDRAEGGLAVEIAVSTFLADSAGYVLSGVASNAGASASPVQRLTFEFLDGQGTVQVSQAIEVPSIPPQGTQPIEIRVPGRGLIAWRYRPS